MESMCSTVYHLMALNFPDDNELWNELAFDEESHAEIIAKAMGFELEDYSDFTVPPELNHVRKTIDYAKEMREKLLNKKVSLKEALEMVKTLHEYKNESYHHDLLKKETEDRVKNVFKRFFEIDKSNLDLIQAVMIKHGFKTGS